MSQLDDDSA